MFAANVMMIGMMQAMPVVMMINRRSGTGIDRIDRVDAKGAFDAADHAADGAPDNRPDRARRTGPHGGAVGDAIRNTLSLRRQRRGKQRRNGGREHKSGLHATTLSCLPRCRPMPPNEGESTAFAWQRGAGR